MANKESVCTPVQEFAQKVGIPNVSYKADKFLKREILQNLGFNINSSKLSEEKREFTIPLVTLSDIDQYVTGRIDQGDFVGMRFINDGGIQGGGYPVIYTGDEQDYQTRRVSTTGGEPQGWETIDGRIVIASPDLLIQTFSGKKSYTANIKGFDNYEGSRDTRIGGGFRIQLDKVNINQPGFDFSSIFVFNDVGPRCTSLSCSFDNNIPRVTMNFSSLQSEDGLVIDDRRYSTDIITRILETKNVREITYLLINQLFTENAGALSKLFNALMDIRPLGRYHSIEGIFSLREDEQGALFLNQTVTDLDGIDTADQWKSVNNSITMIQEQRLIKAHLQLMRAAAVVPVVMNADKLIDQYSSESAQNLSQRGYEYLNWDTKSIYKIIESLAIQIKNLSYQDFVKLHDIKRSQIEIGKILRYIQGPKYTISETSIIGVEISGKHGEIINGFFISIAGEPFGAVSINGKLVENSRELIKILGLPKVVENNLHEGD